MCLSQAAPAPPHPAPPAALLIPPIPPPPSSALAAKLRATQLDNIARAKRQHALLSEPDHGDESYQDFEEGELEAQTRVDLGTKSPKRTVTDSPGHAGNTTDGPPSI